MATFKEVKLNILSVIDNLLASGLTDGESERNESSRSGFMKLDTDAFVISYLEELDGGKVTTDIEIKNDTVSLLRRGAVVSEFFFKEGVKHSSLYQIPPYSFDAEIFTKRIRCSLSEEGGEISLVYNMKIGGADKAVRMKIKICTEG